MLEKEFDWDNPAGISKLSGVSVVVRKNNIESAIRTLKRKVAQEGLLKDLQKHEHFVPGTQKRRKKEAEARRRWLKRQRELDSEI
jgi:small subunit ribosomal protein S21